MSNLDHTPTADLLDRLVARTEAAALRRAARDIELMARAAERRAEQPPTGGREGGSSYA